jgi:demethylmenaquinone methyltransferase/2-methoxy-6-polyprenyl-1,4-benzoquinol methylase
MGHATDETDADRAAAGGAEKAKFVRDAFSRIAPKYDLLNHLLSFNVDKGWRRKAIAELRMEASRSARYLDLCAGTLDVSAAIAATERFTGSIAAVDFAEPMLVAGRRKVAGRRVSLVAGDALRLPLATGSMSGAIVAFGIRNVSDLDAGLAEVHRVLLSGGRFVILEFSTPRSPLINTAYQLYFRNVLPAIGGWVSGHGAAYRYLPRSVANFPVTEELARRMRAVGFRDVSWRSLSLGIAAIHVGVR